MVREISPCRLQAWHSTSKCSKPVSVRIVFVFRAEIDVIGPTPFAAVAAAAANALIYALASALARER
jgi:hypothetical protein